MPSVPFTTIFSRLWDEFTLKPILAAAKSQLPRPDGLARRAFEQVRLLREVVRMIAKPLEPLPAGRLPAVLISLYRDLVYWALVAQQNIETDTPADLATLWERSPADHLLRAAGNRDNLQAIRRLLLGLPMPTALDIGDDEVARLHDFAESLCRDADAPFRRVRFIVARRWLHRGAAATLLVTIALGIRVVAVGPDLDLAKGRPFRTSSSQPGCAEEPKCKLLMFHTQLEKDPWVEIDLGAVKPVHLIETRNRTDCCQERAVPLVAEISVDRKSWKEVGRRTTPFVTWTMTFPRAPARYVRLRAPHTTMLHLKDVVVR